jgi:hypothetical protein
MFEDDLALASPLSRTNAPSPTESNRYAMRVFLARKSHGTTLTAILLVLLLSFNSPAPITRRRTQELLDVSHLEAACFTEMMSNFKPDRLICSIMLSPPILCAAMLALQPCLLPLLYPYPPSPLA